MLCLTRRYIKMGLYKTMKEIFKSEGGKTTLKVLGLMFSISAFLVFITFNWFFEFSAFAVAIAMITVGISIFWVIDRFLLKELDTIEELKKGNTAYAIFLLSIALVLAAAILAV